MEFRSRFIRDRHIGGHDARSTGAVAARLFVSAGGTYALVVGVLTLLGYAFSVPRLSDWDNDGISMFPNAAACAALSGVALLVLTTTRARPSWRIVLRVNACLVALLGGLTLFQHVTSVNLGIDTLLFEADFGQRAAMALNRMGPPASVSYLMIGIALLLVTYGPHARRFTAALGVAVLAIASLSLVGFWLGADQLYGVARFTGISFQTSTAVAAIAIGLIASVPESGLAGMLRRDDPGGVIVRRLTLPIVVIPMVLGWLRVQGEQVGYFDPAFGTGLFGLLMVLMLVTLLWWTAEGLSRQAQLTRAVEEHLRQSETRLRELTTSLEEKVGQRTADLEQQTIRLRRLATELSRVEQSERKRLAALLHDDLQQVLVAARMTLTRSRKQHPHEGAVAEIGRAEELIGEAIETSRSLTRQLRPPALYEGGLVPALEGLASETQRLYRIRVFLSVCEALPILGEELNALLFGCVRELLLNAAKHSGTDEVSVDVRLRDRVLHVAVVDNGNGFDTEAATFNSSNGFGLFSIRERLTAVEGVTNIVSRVGEGCRVELIVPIPERPRPSEPVHASGPHVVAVQPPVDDAETEGLCRVVIADDHPIVREGIANMLDLESRIRVVAQVGDGFDAVEAVERLHPDVVLLDINMPRMNGIEAAREIHRRWPEVAIIGLSVQNDEATANSMLNAGALTFIPKSDHPTTIMNAILGVTVA